METLIKPIFLLSDSQLLFWNTPDGPFLNRVRQLLPPEDTLQRAPKAAYIGASNGDRRDFYDLFVAAMEGIDIRDCRMIPSSLSVDDQAFLEEADIILLAGGDIERGWLAFTENGLNQQILMRYASGAVLIGVSAGAVQLGAKGWGAGDSGSFELFDTFRLVPYVIDVHAESTWHHLQQMVRRSGEDARGIGIPIGGGAIFHHDWTLEPVRYPITEFSLGDEGITQSLLLPPDPHTSFKERPLRRLSPDTDLSEIEGIVFDSLQEGSYQTGNDVLSH